MLALAAAFGASFALVFLRALQQRNVAAARYGAIVFVSLCYAFAEAGVILAVTAKGFHIPTLLAIGIGGASGAICAVQFSKRVFHD